MVFQIIQKYIPIQLTTKGLWKALQLMKQACAIIRYRQALIKKLAITWFSIPLFQINSAIRQVFLIIKKRLQI